LELSRKSTLRGNGERLQFPGNPGVSFKIQKRTFSLTLGKWGRDLASVSAASANGISLSRSNGYVFYNGNVTNNDSFTIMFTPWRAVVPRPARFRRHGTSPGRRKSLFRRTAFVTIKFFGIPNYAYAVQTTTNLGGPWFPLGRIRGQRRIMDLHRPERD